MEIPEFQSVDTLRRLWWLHDSFWHAEGEEVREKGGGPLSNHFNPARYVQEKIL
jgi:hypothetical protein